MLYFHRRQARIYNAPGTWTEADIFSMRLKQDGRCALCAIQMHLKGHRKDSLTVDHVIPISIRWEQLAFQPSATLLVV
jgi:hypothetical protein